MIMHDDGMTLHQQNLPAVGIAPRGYYQTQLVPAKTSHIMHLVLTLVTFGFWSPVWFIVTLYNHNRTVQRQVWQPGQALHVYSDRAPLYPGWAWCTVHATWERVR